MNTMSTKEQDIELKKSYKMHLKIKNKNMNLKYARPETAILKQEFLKTCLYLQI